MIRKRCTFLHRWLSNLKDIKGLGYFSTFLASVLLKKPKNTSIIETLYGFFLKIDPVKDQGIERILYYFRTYEKGTLHMLTHLLKQGDTFVDVGANIGLMSILAARQVGPSGRVIAFEPNPVTRSILEENIHLNETKNIQVEPYAISSSKKKGKIYDRWDINRGGATLIAPSFETTSHEIEEIQLSDYFESSRSIDLIKIDIEGYEIEALKGAEPLLKSKSPPILIVESSASRTNAFEASPVALYDFLKKRSPYQIFKLVKGKERRSKLMLIHGKDQMPFHDNIFCFTENHLQNISSNLFK